MATVGDLVIALTCLGSVGVLRVHDTHSAEGSAKHRPTGGARNISLRHGAAIDRRTTCAGGSRHKHEAVPDVGSNQAGGRRALNEVEADADVIVGDKDGVQHKIGHLVHSNNSEVRALPSSKASDLVACGRVARKDEETHHSTLNLTVMNTGVVVEHSS